MELLLSGIALQMLALALLALVATGEPGEPLLLRLRENGRPEQVPDEDVSHRRRRLWQGLVGLFIGGTMLALLGLPRL